MKVRLELDATRVIPAHVFHFLPSQYENKSLYEMFRLIPLNMWSPVSRKRLFSRDQRTPLAYERGCLGMLGQRSRSCHHKGSNEIIFSWNCRERDVGRSQYGSLAYGDLGKRSRVTKRDGKEYTDATAHLSRKRAMEQNKFVTDSKAKSIRSGRLWLQIARFDLQRTAVLPWRWRQLRV